MALFAGHGGAHGTHREPTQVAGSLKWEIKTTAETLREGPTLEMVRQHLLGERPLGIIPINERSECRWGSIDYDVYDDDMLAVVERVIGAKLPLVPCRSKSGGLHLWLFLKDWHPAALVVPLLRDMAAHLGLSTQKTDIFPRQTQVLTERGDVGNWIITPYFGINGAEGVGTYNSRIKEQYGLKRTGAEMTLGEFLNVAEGTALKELPLPRATAKVNGRPLNGHAHKPPGQGDPPMADDFADGPPCLQHLVSRDILDDGRKRVLFHMGVYYKRATGNWQLALEDANQRWMRPPLPSQEVLGVIRSLEKKEYEYTCKTEPMVSHCDAAACRFRRFGVGDPGQTPQISGLSVLDTHPPIWFVDVGHTRLELSNSDDLRMYDKFHRVCFERLKICYPPIKQADWWQIINDAMDSLQRIEAPKELSDDAKFVEWLEDFCTDRGGGNRREDILRGVAFHDLEHERYVFQMRDFETHLRREKVDMRNLPRGMLRTKIVNMGGARIQFNIKQGTCRSCWWVPAQALLPSVELDTPPKTVEPI